MELLINKLMGGAITSGVVILFLLIIWAIFGKKKQSFANWVGFKSFKATQNIYVQICIVLTISTVLGMQLHSMLSNQHIETATSIFKGMGISALPPILVLAILGTGLPEELVFRGFILKRLQSKFTFVIGNLIQSVLFGAIHGLAFISLLGFFKASLIFIFTCLVAYAMGYMNEKKADGSIFPSIIIHSASNIIAGICAAYLIW